MSHTNEPTREPGVCRCCLSRGVFQSMDVPYWWQGSQENYTDMLRTTFQITLAPLEKKGVVSGRLICDACVLRLRDADAFRRQVHNTELTLTGQLIPVKIQPFEDSHLEGKHKAENVDNVKMEPQEDSKMEEKEMAVNFVSVIMEPQEDSKVEEQEAAVNFVSVKMEPWDESFLDEKKMAGNFVSGDACSESDEDVPLSCIKSKVSQDVNIIKNDGDSVPPSRLLDTLHKKQKNEESRKRRATDADPDWVEPIPLKKNKKCKIMKKYLARKKAGKEISAAMLEEIRLKRERNANRVREYRAQERALIEAAFKDGYATKMNIKKTRTDKTAIEAVSETTSGMSIERILRRREKEAKKKREIRAQERAVLAATINLAPSETYHKTFSRLVTNLSDEEKSTEILEKVRLRRENDAKRMRELRAREKAVLEATIKVAANESYHKAFSRCLRETIEKKTQADTTAIEVVSETKSVLSLESIQLKRENQAKRMREYRARERALIDATMNFSPNQANTIHFMTPTKTYEAFEHVTETSDNEQHMNISEIVAAQVLEKVRLRRENDAKRMRELRAREKAVLDANIKMTPNETKTIQPTIVTEPYETISRYGTETGNFEQHMDNITSKEDISESKSSESIERIGSSKKEAVCRRSREYRARKKAGVNKKKKAIILKTVNLVPNETATIKIETNEVLSRHSTETEGGQQHIDDTEVVQDCEDRTSAGN